jgi:hypothetical protein
VTLRRGDDVRVCFTKWGGGGHWTFPLRVLGQDEHGTWAGGAVGTTLSRPAATFDSAHDWVTLLPAGQPWAASFYDSPEQDVSVYVDMTTVPVWRGREVSMVDLDLDVVLLRDGSLFVDDEDEFDEHRVSLGYPDEVVALARRTAADVTAAIAGGLEPFAHVGARWLRDFRAAS